MADASSQLFTSKKHLFQIYPLPGPSGPYETIQLESGFILRIDIPGVPSSGFEYCKKSAKKLVTFNGKAPRNENFPFDESKRLYSGVVQLDRDPIEIEVDVMVANGCVIMLFPDAVGSLLSAQPIGQTSSGSGNSEHGEGSSSGKGKSIILAEGLLKSEGAEGSFSGKSTVEAEGSGKSGSGNISSQESAQGSAKSEQDRGSSSGISVDKSDVIQNLGNQIFDVMHLGCNCEGSPKSEQGEGSSQKSVNKTEGPSKSEQGEGSSGKFTNKDKGSSAGKSVHKAEGSGKSDPSKGSSNEAADESVPVEAIPTGQSSHEVPEIAIGSVEDCSIHHPYCGCESCDDIGICMKTWSTTEDSFGYVNSMKIMGPDGICEKRVMKEDSWYSVYVRADLPGLKRDHLITTVRSRCILVFGKPQPRERYVQGARNYLFFVQLRCSCCKFENIFQDYEDGVLWLLGRVVRINPKPSAD